MARLRGEFLDCLINAEDFIFDNENSFMNEFCGGLSNELISVGFMSVGVKLNYVLPDGQHITDVIEAHRYNDWVAHRCVVNCEEIGE